MQDSFAEPPPDRNHRRERLETVIIGKFATELDLTPEQAERFFPLFRQFQSANEDIQRRQHQTREELDNLSQKRGSRSTAKSDNPLMNNLAEPSNQNRPVDTILQEREQNQQEMLRLRTQFLKDVGDFLTPQQVSRCSIMLEELPRKIQDMIQSEKRRQHGQYRNRYRSK